MHPDTEVRPVSPTVGYGVFATKFIPAGTVIYVRDELEIVISQKKYEESDKIYQDVINKYAFKDNRGNYILSWDIAKYVNHCCQPNTISTGYDFEIAIKDIQEGEQITDEYGAFNINFEMYCECDKPNCRKIVKDSDFDIYYKAWDEKIKKALKLIYTVPQPLMSLVDAETRISLDDYIAGGANYRSIYALRHTQANGVHHLVETDK